MLRSFYLKCFTFSSDLLRIFIFLIVSSVFTMSHKHRIQFFLVYVATPRGLIVQYSVYKNAMFKSHKLYAESLDNDQIDAHLLYFTIHLLPSSTCFKHYMLIIRRLNCIDAASGIVLSVSGRPVHRTATD